MITISDVAKHVGVSIATVSNVINNNGKVKKETAELVQQAIKELNYIPNQIAKGLKTSQTNTIGIMAEDIGSYFSIEMINGICDCAELNGYTINLCNLRINPKITAAQESEYSHLAASQKFQRTLQTNLNNLLSSRICALIYIGTFPRDLSGLLPTLDIPVVYAYSYNSDSDSYSVNHNEFEGGKLATEYLISKGHKKIGLISGYINSYLTHQRMMGYQTALMEHQLSYIPEYVCAGNWIYQDGFQQCCKLLDLPEPPTAIFAMSDVMAYGAMNAAKSRGLNLPNDLSIIGFDGLDLSAYTWPALTTIQLPLRNIGLQSCQKAISLVTKQHILQKNDYLPCTLLERDSVCAINIDSSTN